MSPVPDLVCLILLPSTRRSAGIKDIGLFRAREDKKQGSPVQLDRHSEVHSQSRSCILVSLPVALGFQELFDSLVHSRNSNDNVMNAQKNKGFIELKPVLHISSEFMRINTGKMCIISKLLKIVMALPFAGAMSTVN